MANANVQNLRNISYNGSEIIPTKHEKCFTCLFHALILNYTLLLLPSIKGKFAFIHVIRC